MRLKLAIGGNVIASILLNEEKAGNLEYVYTKRCLLTEACADTIASQADKPVFFIEVPSKMNSQPLRR
jgi:hypothetical protein